MGQDRGFRRGWYALGCLTALAACGDRGALDGLETDVISLGVRTPGQPDRLDLTQCSNTDCDGFMVDPEPIELRDVASQALVSPASPSWERRLKLPSELDGCDGGCELTGVPALAVAADGSLWALASTVQGGTDSDAGVRVGAAFSLWLLHHESNGRVVGARRVDHEEPDPEVDQVFYDSQLLALEGGRLIAFVHKSVGKVAPSSDWMGFEPISIRQETWMAEFDADAIPVGGRTALELPMPDSGITASLVLSPAGGARAAFVHPMFWQDPPVGFAGVLDLKRRAVKWLQTRGGLDSTVYEVSGADNGALSALSVRGPIESVEHYDPNGRLQWVRSMTLDDPGIRALSRAVDGDLLYTAVTWHPQPLPLKYYEELLIYKLNADGYRVMGTRTLLPDRGAESNPGAMLSRPRATTLADGSLVIPIGARGMNQLADEVGLFGSLFYALDADGETCRLINLTTSGLESLHAGADGGLYFASWLGYGRLDELPGLLPSQE